jgi:hypothetical protein
MFQFLLFTQLFTLLSLLTVTSVNAAGGQGMCVLFVSNSFRGFHFGRVDFSIKKLVDIMPLPSELTGAEGGVAAGADEGQFFIPNANIAYNFLYDVNILKNSTISRTISPPIQYKGSIPAFYTMQTNGNDDLWTIFEESTRISWVAVATVFPTENASSVAISSNFASQRLKFQWRKAGVATVDTRRDIFYFVAGVGSAGVETLVGVPVGDATKPVKFVEYAGPSGNSSDIDFLGYSSSLDLFVASCFSINTGIGSIKTMTGDGTSGWTTIYTWGVDKETSMELGNAAVSADGKTFFVAMDSGSTDYPQYFQFDLPSGKLVTSFEITEAEWPGLITAEVVSC